MARRKGMSKRFFSGLIGFVLIAVSLTIALYSLNSSKGVPGQAHTYFFAKFSNTGDLNPDADLREADYRIGRVDAVDYTGDGVGTVRLQVDDTRKIYKNANVQIVSRSGLGQKYVNVNRGTPDAGELEQNGTIPVTQTQPSVEILDLAQIFDPKTTTAAQDALSTLGAGAEGHAKDLSDAVNSVPSTLPKLGTVARALNNNNGRDINSVLSSLRGLSSRFEGRQQDLVDLNKQLAVTLDAVNVDKGKGLADLLRVAPPAFREVRKTLVDLQQPLETTTEAVTNIRPGVRALVDATPDVRGVLREAPRPLDRIPGVSDVGQPALRALTPALRDLRPLVPRLRDASNSLNTVLPCLAAYSPDIGRWFTSLSDILQQGDSKGNWARFTLVPTTGSVVGAPETNPIFQPTCPPPPSYGKPGYGTKPAAWGDKQGANR